MEEGFLGSEDEYLLHLSLGDSISATLELIHVIELETNSTIYLLNIEGSRISPRELSTSRFMLNAKAHSLGGYPNQGHDNSRYRAKDMIKIVLLYKYVKLSLTTLHYG